LHHITGRKVRAALAIVTTAALAITIAGCTSSGSTSQDAKAPLKLWVNATTNKADWKGALAAFTTKTGIDVTPTYYQNDQYKQQIANATGTSTMPDVFVQWSGIGLLGNIYDAGAIEPMDKYFTKYNWDDRFGKTAIASITLDDKKMGVPFQTQEMGVVYKKSTFEKAGVTPPKTFAQLEKAMQTFKDKGITPWSFAGKNSWDTMRLTDSLIETTCGAKQFDALRDLKANWKTSSCAEKGFQTFKDWVAAGDLVPDYMGLDPNTNVMWKPIIAGTAAMTIDGNWSGAGIKTLGGNPDDYGYFAFPTDTDRLSYFATSIYVGSKSKNIAGGAALANFLTEKSTVEKYPGILNGAISATDGVTPASTDPYDAGWVALGKEYSGVYGPSDQAFPPDVAQAYLLNNDKLQLGQETPAQVTAAIQQAAETYKASKPSSK
jgi:raffinose/stachyose/melibiose transport system substrate-binding protein